MNDNITKQNTAGTVATNGDAKMRKADNLEHLAGMMVMGTSGYIEAQEALGQRQLVNSSLLPLEMSNPEYLKRYHPDKFEAQKAETITRFAQMGIAVGEPEDDLFYRVTLPEGWSRRGTEHNMHSEVLDENGSVRISVFYKAAFYDRKASASIQQRYSVSWEEGVTDNKEPKCVLYVAPEPTQKEIEVHAKANYPGLFEKGEIPDFVPREVKCTVEAAWLSEHFPNYRDPLAYWND